MSLTHQIVLNITTGFTALLWQLQPWTVLKCYGACWTHPSWQYWYHRLYWGDEIDIIIFNIYIYLRLKAKLPLINSEFISNDKLVNIAKKSTWSWACDQLKTGNLFVDNSKKKTCHLKWLTPEPAIWLCDTGQRIPYFDSCQLTTTWIYNTMYLVAGSHTS